MDEQTALSVSNQNMWKQYRGLVVFFFGTALLLGVAWVLRRALLLIYVSILMAVLLAPIVAHIRKLRIRKWRPSQGAAVVVLFLGVLALVAGALLYFVPLVAIVAGLLTAVHSVTKLLGVVVFFVAYHNLENSVLNPRIMESKVKVPAVTIVVALIIGEACAGIVGMLIAVPSAVLISVLIDEYISSGRSDVLVIGEEQGKAA